ncbi:MAG TPA: polysaccharide deacetylase family protein [Bacteroidales bacterium]|mgnify:CR=1 FL=1|nr:polysaccharide deacetylase family protein [Bacteroidales bacterium]HPT20311.1 polysaccharide deacetylase family protein [Bacteroidales bacterium]
MALIFNFHELQDVNWFDSTVLYLTSKYKPVSLDELMNLYRQGTGLGNVCHFTFDDGASSFYKFAYPVLKKHNVPSTVFVSPDAAINRKNLWFQEIEGCEARSLLSVATDVLGIGEKTDLQYPVCDVFKCLKIELIWEIINRYQRLNNLDRRPCKNMSADEIKEVESSGLVTVGAHTILHPILANEDSEVSKNEIKLSFELLSDSLGHDIKYFAYPNGLYDFDYGQREISILKDSGCVCAFSTSAGRFNRGSDLYSIPRIGLSCYDSRPYINAKLITGSYWDLIRKIKPGNEINNRKSISDILKANFSEVEYTNHQ